jgi:AmiR/NasT family two-component response regulator
VTVRRELNFVCKPFAKICHEAIHLKIKTLTANAQTDDREAVILAGLDGLLIKPLDRERLREALSTASARAFDPLAA